MCQGFYNVKMDNIQVIDDYLSPKEYEMIRSCVMGENDRGNIKDSFLWQWALEPDGHFQFCHLLYSSYYILSPYFDLMRPIISKENMVSIARIKANLVTCTEDVIVYDQCFHQDFSPESSKRMTTGIYYINTNDGYTLFEDGTKVESVGNRFLRFPGYMRHTGTSCSNVDRRVLINFNYYT